MKTRKILALLLVLVMMMGLLSMSAVAYGTFTNPLTLTTMKLTFGDNSNLTWPESCMYFALDSGNTYQAFYSTNGSTETTGYYPDILSIYIEPEGTYSISSIVGTDVQFVTYNSTTGEPTYSTTTTVNSQGFYAICPQSANSKIVITPSSGSGDAVTVKFKAPLSQTASGGTTPKTVCGYLPVGQFARPNSYGWGTIYTDNTNVYTSTKTPKFTTGYVSTGVSLGMLGGYVQFEFADAIGNDADNPYGIDFIIYGNPFNGNPEAGSVMVYGKNTKTNAYGWYNLAGSRHYLTTGTGADKTKWNVNVSYIKIASANTTIGNRTFTKAGVYYSTDYVTGSYNATAANTAISNATWYAIPNSAATVISPVASSTSGLTTVGVSYWPEQGGTENYDEVWKMHRPDTTTVGETGIDSHVGKVFWQTNGSAPVITYKGVTRVGDSDTTDDYRFGYADVRQNGTNYGVAVNPYATAPSEATGGDGFDLSWAVDTNGNPVSLTDVRFVRVYSAVLYNAGVFGETSAEVCGIYVASGTGSGANNGTLSLLKANATTPTTMNANAVTEVSAGTYSFKSNDTYVYFNGSQVTDANTTTGHVFSIAAGDYVQIISQSGTRSPFITVLKGV